MPVQNYFKIIDAECSAKDTYDFTIARTSRIGHITAIKFTNGGKELKADTKVSNPESPDSKVDVVAVVDRVKWEGGPTDPIEFSARFSPEGKSIMKEALSSLTGGTEIELTWIIYEYDHKAKKYFQRFHTDGKGIKLVITKGTQLYVGEDPDTIIQQPMNFIFDGSFTAKNEGGKQELCCALSASAKFNREIGVDVA